MKLFSVLLGCRLGRDQHRCLALHDFVVHFGPELGAKAIDLAGPDVHTQGHQAREDDAFAGQHLGAQPAHNALHVRHLLVVPVVLLVEEGVHLKDQVIGYDHLVCGKPLALESGIDP
jgi:hypothetical protein